MFPSNTPISSAINTIPRTFGGTPMILSGMQLLRVKSLDGAKAYPTQPNSMYPLFDEDADILYVKITDANNYPLIRIFDLVERVEKEPEIKMDSQYVTVEDFNQLKEELENVKQLIQKSNNTVTTERNGFSKSNCSGPVSG